MRTFRRVGGVRELVIGNTSRARVQLSQRPLRGCVVREPHVSTLVDSDVVSGAPIVSGRSSLGPVRAVMLHGPTTGNVGARQIIFAHHDLGRFAYWPRQQLKIQGRIPGAAD